MRVRQQLVTSRARTYTGKNTVKYITVHETANPRAGADAAAHANLQSKVNVRNASWHWQVDDTEAVQSFPHTVQCWHAGDGRGPGNLTSIAIEICVNSDGNYAQALRNAATLVRRLMVETGVPLSRVVQHSHWSGKNCPANIRAGRAGIDWNAFLALVVQAPSPVAQPATPAPAPAGKTIAQLAQEVIDGKHGNGPARVKALGAQYAAVQAEVNRRLLGKAAPAPARPGGKKSISQMATEVLQGKHGNGHDRRRASLGISAAAYAQVRAEVNRRA